MQMIVYNQLYRLEADYHSASDNYLFNFFNSKVEAFYNEKAKIDFY